MSSWVSFLCWLAMYSSVTCAEVEGTRKDNRSISGWTPSVTLKCAYSDANSLVTDLLGERRIWPFGGGTNRPRAFSATITPYGQTGVIDVTSDQFLVYEQAMVEVQYQPLQFTVPGDGEPATPYVAFSESVTPFIDFRRDDHTKRRWSDDGLVKKDETGGKRLMRMRFNRQYFGWVGALPIEFLTLQGHTNSSTVSSGLLGLDFDPETLVYGAGPVNYSIRSDGNTSVNVTMQFEFKEEGWNKYWRVETQSYERQHVLIGTGAGAQIDDYELSDLSPLFV